MNDTADIVLRQYWFLLERNGSVAESVDALREHGGEDVVRFLDGLPEIAEVADEPGVPGAMLARILEIDAGRVSETVLVLHFRSALARLEAQLGQYRGLLTNRSRYVGLLGLLAASLLLLTEFYLRPVFTEIIEGFGGDLPVQLGGGAILGTWVTAGITVVLLGASFWIDRAFTRLHGFFGLAWRLHRLRPFRRFRQAWHAYLTAVFTRLLVAAGAERADAVETVRQAVNAELGVDADAQNIVNQLAVLRDLELGARLGTLDPELEFWETRALQDTVDRIIAVRQIALNGAYTLLALLAFVLVWRAYGVLFTFGSVIA